MLASAANYEDPSKLDLRSLLGRSVSVNYPQSYEVKVMAVSTASEELRLAFKAGKGRVRVSQASPEEQQEVVLLSKAAAVK